jgi:phage protein D
MAQATLDAKVTLAGKDVPGDEVFDLQIEADLDHADMAAITLSNQSTPFSTQVNLGDTLEIKAGLSNNKSGTVFKGEVTGIEPQFVASGPARVVVRAMNALHRLMRGKKAATYRNMTDAQIVEQIARANKLKVDFGGDRPSVQHEHIYQYNQTDLEFLRLRAARLGRELLVQDTQLFFRKRTTEDSGVKLVFGETGEATLESFLPRLSTATQVSEVRVRGWDPEKKKEIVGVATSGQDPLGGKSGADVAKRAHGQTLHFDVDTPVVNKEEADLLAKAILQERLMSYITGEGTCKGNPDLKAGMIVGIEVRDPRFDGKYYLTAVRHRYVHQGAANGFRTHFKFRRDAEG